MWDSHSFWPLWAFFVPLGVSIGLWLNKRIPEQMFIKFVYLFTFLAGLQLILK